MDIDLNITDKAKQAFTLKTSEEARSFLEAELQFWTKQKERLGSKLDKQLASAPARIAGFLDKINYLDAELENPKTPNINQRRQAFENEKQAFVNWATQHWIYRGGSFVEAMLAAYEYSQASGNAFRDSIISNRAQMTGNPPGFDSFTGLLMAYEYRLQDQSHLVKRRNAEKKSFERLRKDLEDERSRLLVEITEFRNEVDSWRNRTEGSFKEWFERMQQQTADWFNHYKEDSENAVAAHSELFNSMADEAIKRNKELEALYREKLRLEAPAKYWADRAGALGRQGKGWARLLVLFSLLLSVAAGAFFWEWLTNKSEIPFGLHSLQGVALFGASAAAAVFLVRVLSRLTFSSYHLQRDAEEREQLSHLYLSLINEGALDTESRDIVLQALFSRSDSGLLGGDHGPTMPSPADVIAGVSRVKN
jgi:exonuclease VII large subunit